jgi:sodium-dependent dicarboxylate transporter 2/3/5
MDLTPEARTLALIVIGVIVLWVTEALPLAVTALLGAVACVVGGVAPAAEVFRPFADPLIFLFIGAFILAEAIRVHGLDRRLAYTVLAVPWVDGRPRRILVAVAAVCTIASAFLSNTCTTAMMLAIVSGILTAIDEAAAAAGPDAPRPAAGFATGLLLCVAFASSIGGLATPIGTPPNLIGLGFIRNQLGINVTFLGWCAVGVPLVLAMTAVIVAILTTLFPAGVTRVPGVVHHVAAERARLGAWTIGQRSTAVAFALTVTLWVAPGILLVALGPSHPVCQWLRDRLPEGVAALIGAVLLFILPGDRPAVGGPRPRALAWPQARIDWGIVLLYGGGMALGQLCFSTGLAEAVGRSITGWIPAGPWQATLLVAVAAAVAAFTSEFTSNTASATMVVPVVIALGQASGGQPLAAALAATFASSLGFMMPVSTPCNAIVYGSGRVPMRSMMRAGILLDLAGTALVTALLLATANWFTG